MMSIELLLLRQAIEKLSNAELMNWRTGDTVSRSTVFHAGPSRDNKAFQLIFTSTVRIKICIRNRVRK